ncbi:MAG: hypothetical protein HUJ26_10985 [Planctomycetaceae bacterium]|nr:hypothetical protein [Planctomycetaceae bacterium]
MRGFILLLLLSIATSPAKATDRYFPNITVHSPSGTYRVEATSPENKENEYSAFQSDFTYRFIDTMSGEVIWSRKQAMGKPFLIREDPPIRMSRPLEASPIDVYVSNSGWTVIRTHFDELIVVSRTGKDIGKHDLLEDGFTKQENRDYVHHTTAGPYWTGLSIWYFISVSGREYFVVRPWWGRRLFVDLKKGLVQNKDLKDLVETAKARETELILDVVHAKTHPDQSRLTQYQAAYLSGVLGIKEAIPFLRRFEKSEYSGSSVFGGLSFGEEYKNEVDPHSYYTLTHRQVAQLSLRRLGETPSALPCHIFKLENGDQSKPFFITSLKKPRHHNVESLKVGMDAKQVLELVGSPDFVSRETWSYDMDSDEPFSLNLTFDERRVTEIHRVQPLWESGHTRDYSLAY